MSLQRHTPAVISLATALAAIAGIGATAYLVYASWNPATTGQDALARATARADARLVAQYGMDAGDIEIMKTATGIQPRLSDAWIGLSVMEELQGNSKAALHALRKAHQYDTGFQPRWALANFFFRQDRLDDFWEWARKCAAIPYARYQPIIELCFRLDPAGTFQRIGPGDARFQRQFVDYTLAVNQIDAGVAAALHLAVAGLPEDRDRLLDYCDRCLAAGNSPAAVGIWARLIESHVVRNSDASGRPDDLLNDPEFESRPVGRGFAWRLYPRDGVEIIVNKGLSVMLSGNQPETCFLAEQHVATPPGTLLNLEVETQSTDLEGLAWIAYPLMDWSKPLGMVAVGGAGKQASSLRVPSNADLIRIVLRYRRPAGSVRSKGESRFKAIRLRRLR